MIESEKSGWVFSFFKDKHPAVLLFQLLAFVTVIYLGQDYCNLWGALSTKPPFGHDFGYVYNISSMVLTGQTDLYENDPVMANARRLNLQFVAPFFYPPAVFVAFVPFALMSFDVARKLWFLLNHFFVLSSMHLIYLWLRPLTNRSLLPDLVLLVPLVFTMSPFLDLFFGGQINGLILWLLCISITTGLPIDDDQSTSSARSWRTQCASLTLAMAIILKIPTSLFLMYLVLQRRWALVVSTLVWTVSLYFLPLCLFGWKIYAAYFAGFKGVVTAPHQESWNQCLTGLLARSFIGGEFVDPIIYLPWLVRPLYLGLSTIMTLLVFAICRKRSLGQLRVWQVSLVTLSMFVLAPISEPHHHVWGLIPLVALLLCEKPSTTYVYVMIPIYGGLAVLDGEVTGRSYLYIYKQLQLLNSVPTILIFAWWVAVVMLSVATLKAQADEVPRNS